MNAGELTEGTLVLHQQRRDDGSPVVVQYTLRRLEGDTAVLSTSGTRKLARVPVATITSSPAWAVQETLW